MLETKLKYTFKNKDLLKNALVHKSYIKKGEAPVNNERLEFLGDSVLGFSVAEYLYKNYSLLPEGELTKIRSTVVCESCLYRVAKKIGLGEEIYMGKGEEQTSGRNRPSILSDAMEAIFAAIFLDGGIDAAKSVVLDLLMDEILQAVSGRDAKDYKTMLQELVQKDGAPAPGYMLIKEEGPDHDKTFTSAVLVGGKVLGKGLGKTKKEAEKEAAKTALEVLFPNKV